MGRSDRWPTSATARCGCGCLKVSEYKSFHDTDGPPIILDDGARFPGRHDGMGAFVGVGRQQRPDPEPRDQQPGRTVRRPRELAYDTKARGGCTTTVVSITGEVRQAWTSLNGTMMNCAGGQMPWGAWITCEETVNGPDVGPDFTSVSNIPLTRPHGLHLRGPGRRRLRRRAGHRRGSLPPRGRVIRPGRGHPLLDRGQLRVPVGLLPLHPAVQPDGDRPSRERRQAPDAEGRRR